MTRKDNRGKRLLYTSVGLTAIIVLAVFTAGIAVTPAGANEKLAKVTRELPDYVKPNETFTVTLTQSGFVLDTGIVWEVLPEGFEYVDGSYTGGAPDRVIYDPSTRTLEMPFAMETSITYRVNASSSDQTTGFSGTYNTFVQGCIYEEEGDITGDTEVNVDGTPPYTDEHNPAKGATGVAVDTNVVVHVKDNFEVDPCLYTIEMTVNGNHVSPSIVPAGPGTTNDWVVRYNPSVDFGSGEEVNVTINASDETGNAMPTDVYSFTTVGPPVPRPDLTVTAITPDCGYLFANESNEVCAEIKNNGTADAGAFNVSFDIDGFSEEVRVSGLAAGEDTEVCVTDTTIRTAGESVTITVTADCNTEIDESDEANNDNSTEETVVNNGYKGKRYTGGEDIVTIQNHTLRGNLTYSVGDSYYLSGATGWTTYTSNWAASDLPVPGDATIEKARLYVMYTWDKADVMPDEVSLTFNGNAQARDAFYTDRKGYDGYDYPYGMLAYNVAADFDKSGNSAVLTNSHAGGGDVSIRGMLLVVIYADESEAQREIFINEGFDLLYGGSYKCTTPAEATAYAPFADAIGDIANKSARLITVAPGAGPNEGELIFNGNVWTNVWNFAGSTQIGIDDRDVTAYLDTANEARFQSSGDYMEASNAILVVEEILPERTLEYNLIKKTDSTGKNWISIPLDTTIINASSLMAAIGPTCEAVTRWNPEEQNSEAWISYMGGMGTNFDIVHREGYEVSVTANTTFYLAGAPVDIGQIDLIKKPGSTGKNWVGLPYSTKMTNASSLMAAIWPTCEAVTRWNPEEQNSEAWISYMGGMGTNFDVVSGEGYEVSVTANTTWTPT